MLIVLSVVSYWFAALSSIPQYFIEKSVDWGWHPWVKWLISKLACTKCVAFWVGMYWYHSLILAALCSFIAIVVCRIYYKLLS